jgi:sulfoxide reductase catalytic subunit YedY
MLIKRQPDLTYADVTLRERSLGRRNFLVGLVATAGIVAGWKKLPGLLSGPGTGSVPVGLNGVVKSSYTTSEKITPESDVTTYNNYYEFGTDKGDPAKNAKNFQTSPWRVSVEGEVVKPRKFTMDEIMKLAPLEERIYRHRCVETWSIVVPWIGYSLSTLLNQVQPTSNAKYVAFESYYDPKQMPLGGQAGIALPYLEGLRLDEAMNPLALLCVGMYGETLPNQDGAPVRLVIPWKYGFKSIKSIVKIRLVKDQPQTTWNMYTGSSGQPEYGFYANVNPSVDHARWSQSKERRLGEFLRRPTLLFNGYGDQVASLYSGMDLRKNY